MNILTEAHNTTTEAPETVPFQEFLDEPRWLLVVKARTHSRHRLCNLNNGVDAFLTQSAANIKQTTGDIGIDRVMRVQLDSVQVAVELEHAAGVVKDAIAVRVRVGTQGPKHSERNSAATLKVPLPQTNSSASLHASMHIAAVTLPDGQLMDLWLCSKSGPAEYIDGAAPMSPTYYSMWRSALSRAASQLQQVLPLVLGKLC